MIFMIFSMAAKLDVVMSLFQQIRVNHVICTWGYSFSFMLKSTEHGILNAHKI